MFIARLDRLFRLHNVHYGIRQASQLEQTIAPRVHNRVEVCVADDVAMVDGAATTASARVNAIAAGSLPGVAMVISDKNMSM